MSSFLLVFDLDGTLVDSAPDLHAALNQMLRERGRRLDPEKTVLAAFAEQQAVRVRDG